MSGSPRGGRQRTRTAEAGLQTAWNRCRSVPDPPGLQKVTGNNRGSLRIIAKLVHVLCEGAPGTEFFLGSKSLGKLLGEHQRTAHRWIRQLEKQQIIRRVWAGRPCRNDERGNPIAGGRLVNRASEFVYLGLPAV